MKSRDKIDALYLLLKVMHDTYYPHLEMDEIKNEMNRIIGINILAPSIPSLIKKLVKDGFIGYWERDIRRIKDLKKPGKIQRNVKIYYLTPKGYFFYREGAYEYPISLYDKIVKHLNYLIKWFSFK